MGRESFRDDPFARRASVREVAGGVEAVAEREFVLTRAMRALFDSAARVAAALLGVAFAVLWGSAAVAGATCPPGWSCSGDPVPRWAPPVLALVGVALFGGGAYATYVTLAGRLGAEFVRVDAGGVAHGFRWLGREAALTRHSHEEVDGLRADGMRLLATKMGRDVLALLEGVEPADVEEAARRLGASLVAPRHAGAIPARVRIEERADGGLVVVSGARWGRIAAGFLVFGAPALGVVYVAMEHLAETGEALPAVLASLFAAYVLGVVVWLAARVGPAPTRIEIAGGQVLVRRGFRTRRVAFASRPRVALDTRDLHLVEGTRRLPLGFERLEPEERPGCVPAMERLVERAWPQRGT